MTQRVRLDPAAQAELDAALDWYEAEHPGLGMDLLSAVRAAIHRISAHARSYAVIPHAPRQLPVRKLPLERFPYSLFFLEIEETLWIVAIAHQHRRPGYWRDRLRRFGEA